MSRPKTKDPDFLSWDEDLDLVKLFHGDFTDYYFDDSDSEFESEKTNKLDECKTVTGYVCPHCSKCLKTVSK